MKVEQVITHVRSVLSPEEEKIFHFINDGKGEVFTNSEIANKLGLNQGTVRRYTRRLSREERIFYVEVSRQRYYGNRDAVRRLRTGLESMGKASDR